MLFFAGAQKAYATHVMGADITYKCIDTLKFKITVKYYRYCGGVPFGDPSRVTKVICTKSGKRADVKLTRQSIRNVTPTCSNAQNPCNPVNTDTDMEGIEEHVYDVTIDFNKAPYKNLLSNGCCEIRVETGQCCRNGNINTGPTGNFYTYATLDLCKAPCNSSPALTTEPIAYLCCNQPFYYNNGASDTADFDSLSYSFAHPLRGWASKIGYTGQYSYSNPFDAYYPGNLKPPYKNSNANPPIGISLDPQTGDLIFTPVKCDEITVAVLEVKEWRKNASGKYEVIGVTRRDMQFWTKKCAENNAPTIKGTPPSICEGTKECFTITTDDKVKIPPPPLPRPDPDTVTISWNRGIPGATFTVTNPLALHQSGRFCWTPPIGSASSLPYTFTVTARDDACPLNAVTVKAFQVLVKPQARAKRVITKLDCGRYAIEVQPEPNFDNPAVYNWQLKDTNGVVLLGRSHGYIESSNSFTSNKQYDTIQFRKGGRYILQMTVNNRPKCPNDYYDTIDVPELLEVDLAFGPDTFVCAGTTLRLQPDVTNGVQPVSFNWGSGDTTSFLDIVMPPNTPDSAFYVEIKDQNGCTAWDSTEVFLRKNPTVDVGPDRRICTYNSINVIPTYDVAYWDDPRDTSSTLIAQGDTLLKQWKRNTTNISKDTALFDQHLGGEYVLTVTDSLGCEASDTMQLVVNDTVTANAGDDQVLCWNDWAELIGTGLDTSGNEKTGTYRWWDITDPSTRTNLGTKDTLAYYIQTSTDYQLELFVTEDTTTCYHADSVTIMVNPLPDFDMPSDMEVCYDAGVINLKLNEDPTATGGKWSCPSQPNMIENDYLFLTDSSLVGNDASKRFQIYYTYVHPSTGCIRSDSFEIKVNPLPKVELRDGYFCQDKEVVDLKDDKIIALPGGGTLALGRQAWKCVDCGTYDESKIIEDQGSGLPGAPQKFVAHINENTIPLGAKLTDTIRLEFEFRNVFGCYNRDTGKITITKVPKITFTDLGDFCWDEGSLELKGQSGVLPADGYWRAIDSVGFAPAANLNQGLKSDSLDYDSLDTRATVRPLEGTSSTYVMRYYHDRSGCPTWRDTTITIHGLPVPIISEDDLKVHTNSEPYTFCELDPTVGLTANYSGGTWSSDQSQVLSGSTFDPGSAVSFAQPFYVHYDYTDLNGCAGKDSVQVELHQQHKLERPRDTVLCRDGDNMTLDLSATYENAGGIRWLPVLGGTISNDTEINTTFSFTSSIDTAQQFIVNVATVLSGDNVCPFVEDNMQIIVHPKPIARIVADTLNGCNPVDVDFTVEVQNKIDPLNSEYQWTYQDGGSATAQNTTYTFDTDGDNGVDVLVTSEAGCDTTITTNVAVYPIPKAAFTPNPRSTTAALPKVQFNNESEVDPVLGSTITTNTWDFGVDSDLDDTSSMHSPLFFYPSDTGTYRTTLTVTTQYGCTHSTVEDIVIGPDILVFIPNAFSPDGGGPEDNDGFRAVVNDAAQSYHLIIFNRWGEVLWESTDREEEWDGKYGTNSFNNRLEVPEGVYAYHLEITSWSGENFKYSGTVTLIR